MTFLYRPNYYESTSGNKQLESYTKSNRIHNKLITVKMCKVILEKIYYYLVLNCLFV